MSVVRISISFGGGYSPFNAVDGSSPGSSWSSWRVLPDTVGEAANLERHLSEPVVCRRGDVIVGGCVGHEMSTLISLQIILQLGCLLESRKAL